MPIDNGVGYYRDEKAVLARLRREDRIQKTLDILGWIVWGVACLSFGALLGILIAMGGR